VKQLQGRFQLLPKLSTFTGPIIWLGASNSSGCGSDSAGASFGPPARRRSGRAQRRIIVGVAMRWIFRHSAGRAGLKRPWILHLGGRVTFPENSLRFRAANHHWLIVERAFERCSHSGGFGVRGDRRLRGRILRKRRSPRRDQPGIGEGARYGARECSTELLDLTKKLAPPGSRECRLLAFDVERRPRCPPRSAGAAGEIEGGEGYVRRFGPRQARRPAIISATALHAFAMRFLCAQPTTAPLGA
jgi:hypothetical protein